MEQKYNTATKNTTQRTNIQLRKQKYNSENKNKTKAIKIQNREQKYNTENKYTAQRTKPPFALLPDFAKSDNIGKRSIKEKTDDIFSFGMIN